MSNPPFGYTYKRYYVSGSNVNFILFLICKSCGMAVGDHHQHNKWHQQQAKMEADLLAVSSEDNHGETPPVRGPRGYFERSNPEANSN